RSGKPQPAGSRCCWRRAPMTAPWQLFGGFGPDEDERFGVGVSVVDPLALIHLQMSASSSITLRGAERGRSRVVRSANQRSTRFGQDLLVGVKCRWKRGRSSSQALTCGVLWVA